MIDWANLAVEGLERDICDRRGLKQGSTTTLRSKYELPGLVYYAGLGKSRTRLVWGASDGHYAQ